MLKLKIDIRFSLFAIFLKSYWNIKLSLLNVLKVIYKTTKKLLSLRRTLKTEPAVRTLALELIIIIAMLYPKL